MFSGIIEETGTVVEKRDKGNMVVLGIRADKVFDDLSAGDSISVDGVCLTIENIKFPVFYVSLSPETIRLTTLGNVKPKTSVNLERAVKYGSRIGGHLLSGHIDFKTRITSIRRQGDSFVIVIKIPAGYSDYFVKKGSIGVDGISLTVADLSKEHISIWLIPHTIKNTTMKNKKNGEEVNVEIDMMVKTLIEKEINIKGKHAKISKEAIF